MQTAAHHHPPHKTAGFAHPVRNVAALGIQPGMHVVDFGSGSGAYALALADRLENVGHVYAIDVQRDLLRRTLSEAHRRGYRNVDVVWADLERPKASKIGENSVDLVLISNLLFQVDNKAAVLAEAFRILKATGRLAIMDWTASHGGMGPAKQDVFTKDAAIKLARECGFELAHEFAAGAHHYGLIFLTHKHHA